MSDLTDKARPTAPAGKKAVVLIPAYNEEEALPRVLRDVARFLGCDAVVIDDCSTDGTAAVARGQTAVVLPLVIQLGAWGAAQTGLRYAYKQGYDLAITMDADGQHLAETVPSMLHAMDEQHADVAIGAYTERGSVARHIAWRLFRWMSGLNLGDLTSGLRIYNRRAMEVLASPEASLLEYQDLGVLLRLRSAGLSMLEVPVEMESRSTGISRIFSSWGAVFYYMAYSVILSMSKRSFGRGAGGISGPRGAQ